jgi:histidyl-tRNA synthetase
MHSNILRVYDCKTPTCQEIYRKDAPRLAENMCPACTAEWKQLQELLEMLSVSFSVQHTLVRGLDYYNKTVFEFVSSNLGAQNAFCGGGRYDHLVAEVGGKQDQPAIGAAIGIERLMLILEQFKDKLPLPTQPALHVVIPMSPDQQVVGLLVAQELTSHNLCTDVLLENDSLKSMMRKANKMGAKYCLIIGSQEQERHEISVKDMVTGQETKVKQIELVSFLKK